MLFQLGADAIESRFATGAFSLLILLDAKMRISDFSFNYFIAHFISPALY